MTEIVGEQPKKCQFRNCRNEVYTIKIFDDNDAELGVKIEKIDGYPIDYCILHCEKPIKTINYYESNPLMESLEDGFVAIHACFTIALKEHINDIKSNPLEQFRIALEYGDIQSSKPTITLTNIHFPSQMLALLDVLPSKIGNHIERGQLHYTSLLPNTDYNIIFENCVFYGANYSDFLDIDILFKNCIFENEIYLEEHNKIQFKNHKGTNSLFTNCVFKKSVQSKAALTQLDFELCEFQDRFEISDRKQLKIVSLKQCTFHQKFNFTNNQVTTSTMINDCNFLDIADFYRTNCKGFTHVEKCNFEKITVFEECNFEDSNHIATFKHVTFKEQAIFRSAKFEGGLDLSTVNFYSDANFLDIEIEKDKPKNKKTNRETFRLIKHSFDSIGNTLGACRTNQKIIL